MRTVGFTRPSERLEDSVRLAESLGLEVVAAPSLSIVPGDDSEYRRLESLLPSRPTLVFGSLTAVEMCAGRYGTAFRDMVDGCRIVSIGPATTAELRRNGIAGAEEPDEFSSAGIVRLLASTAEGKAFVLVRSDSGSDVQTEGLTAAGGTVESIATYKLVPVTMCPELKRLVEAVRAGEVEAMAFTSPLSARSFVKAMVSEYGTEEADRALRSVHRAAIGLPTAEALESVGYPADIIPERTTFPDMLKAIRDA